MPDVLIAVPALAERIPRKVESMIPQHLSNSLWAVAKLQDSVPDVLTPLPVITAQVSKKIADMAIPGLRMSLWAAAQLGETGLEAKLSAELARRKA